MFEDLYQADRRKVSFLEWTGYQLSQARDEAAMLNAERVRLAGVTPAQRLRWQEYVAEFGGAGRR